MLTVLLIYHFDFKFCICKNAKLTRDYINLWKYEKGVREMAPKAEMLTSHGEALYDFQFPTPHGPLSTAKSNHWALPGVVYENRNKFLWEGRFPSQACSLLFIFKVC